MFTWDQRISRAQLLSRNNPATRELLDLYIKVAGLQKTIGQSLNGAEHPDIRSLLKFLPQLRSLIKDLGSPYLQEAAAELGDQQETWSELLLKHWERQAQTIDPAQAFLSYVLLQPYAEHVTSHLNVSCENTATQCPACGNPPQVSLLREFNNGTKRFLVCSLCCAEWEFRRVLCPYCGEQHKDKLPVFTAEQFEQGRIEACDTCKSYIKCIDLSKNGNAIPPVDDLATSAFDLWAQEQGFTRRCPNMFLMEAPQTPELP